MCLRVTLANTDRVYSLRTARIRTHTRGLEGRGGGGHLKRSAVENLCDGIRRFCTRDGLYAGPGPRLGIISGFRSDLGKDSSGTRCDLLRKVAFGRNCGPGPEGVNASNRGALPMLKATADLLLDST